MGRNEFGGKWSVEREGDDGILIHSLHAHITDTVMDGQSSFTACSVCSIRALIH